MKILPTLFFFLISIHLYGQDTIRSSSNKKQEVLKKEDTDTGKLSEQGTHYDGRVSEPVQLFIENRYFMKPFEMVNPQNIIGTVMAEFLVKPNGTLFDVKVGIKGTTMGDFDSIYAKVEAAILKSKLNRVPKKTGIQKGKIKIRIRFT